MNPANVIAKKSAEKPTRISLVFGAISPPIKEQLRNQKLEADPTKIKNFQKLAESLARLHVNGIIPDSAVQTGRKNLMAKITKSVKPKGQWKKPKTDESKKN